LKTPANDGRRLCTVGGTVCRQTFSNGLSVLMAGKSDSVDEITRP